MTFTDTVRDAPRDVSLQPTLLHLVPEPCFPPTTTLVEAATALDVLSLCSNLNLDLATLVLADIDEFATSDAILPLGLRRLFRHVINTTLPLPEPEPEPEPEPKPELVPPACNNSDVVVFKVKADRRAKKIRMSNPTLGAVIDVVRSRWGVDDPSLALTLSYVDCDGDEVDIDTDDDFGDAVRDAPRSSSGDLVLSLHFS